MKNIFKGSLSFLTCHLPFATCLFLAIMSTSCTSFNKLSNQNLAPSYDYDYSYLHPKFMVFHESDDSSTLYIEIAPFELLYKKNESNKLTAELKVGWQLFTSYESKQLVDSGSSTYQNVDEGLEAFLIYQLRFRTPGLMNYFLRIEVKDVFRKQSIVYVVPVEKASRQSAQWFMLIKNGIKIPLFRNHVEENESFSIFSNNPEERKMFVRGYFRDFPLATPPYVQNIPIKFNYAADSLFLLDILPSTEIRLGKRGYYHFQYDTIVKHGLTIFRLDEDYPKITDAVQLIESLRYITTQQEYEKLTLSKNKKAAVDSYWSELAGNQDRAKILIRKYYTRVQEANRLFSSYLEGWKTDRGLIYVIFGPPTSVFRTSDTEDWTYGNFNANTSLTFTFDKIYNPFSGNDFILRRNSFYETTWYHAVDRWREGVVIND